MDPKLQAIIKQLLIEGYDPGEVYQALKQQGATDEQLQASWANPAEVGLGEGLAAVGHGAWDAVKGTVNTLGEQIKNNDFLGLAKGLVTGPYNLGKDIGGVLNAAGSPNMPAPERLQALHGGGAALAGLAPMEAAFQSLSKAFPKPKGLGEFDILPPEATGVAPKGTPNPRMGQGASPPLAPIVDQAIDPNIGGPMPSVAQPVGKMGNQPPVQVKPPMAMAPDPNMPMGIINPHDFGVIDRAHTQGPVRPPVPTSPLDMLSNERGMASPKWFEWFNKDNPAVKAFQREAPLADEGVVHGGVENTPIKPKPLPSPSELVDQLPYEMQTGKGGAGKVAPKYSLSPSEAVDRLPQELQTSKGLYQEPQPKPVSQRLQDIRNARNEQIMSDPEFRAKFMQNPERGAISPYGIYSAIKAAQGNPWYQFKLMRDLAMKAPSDMTMVKRLGGVAGNFLDPKQLIGLPFSQQEQ